jgi:hypothetical protein
VPQIVEVQILDTQDFACLRKGVAGGFAFVGEYLRRELRHAVDVRYVDFQRPRPEVIARLGEANQSCPVLVLAAGSPGDGPEVKRAEGQGTRFVSGARDIGNHWANRFGTSRPH